MGVAAEVKGLKRIWSSAAGIIMENAVLESHLAQQLLSSGPIYRSQLRTPFLAAISAS